MCPLSAKFADYAHSVYLYLHKMGYQVECDNSNLTLNKKVRNHQLAQWNFILVCGEQEANEGSVDIRTRDNERIGKMRIDKLHEYFQSLLPNQSNAFEQFYEKAWNPANFGGSCAGAAETVKVTVPHKQFMYGQLLKSVGFSSNVNVEFEVTEDKKKSPHGKYPFMELPDGQVLFETEAIAYHVARINKSSILGSSPFHEAQVNQWVSWAQTSLLPSLYGAVAPLIGYGEFNQDKFNAAMKGLLATAKLLDGQLAGKKWVTGDSITLADLYIGGFISNAFQLVFGAEVRKSMPNLQKWWDLYRADKAVIKAFGNLKACEVPVKDFEGEKAEAADDDLDLFGDEDEVDAEAAKKAAEAAKAAAKGKKKKEVIAQSLVMFEVKPVDSDTNLDDLAQRIFKISMEGLYWKTQYKKEPVAFGIFKLIIGVTVEDEKVSVDGLQEKIEEFEDMVQSVEILAFNKI